MMLAPDDFTAFFEEVHGYEPFPWQEHLLRQVASKGEWPSVLDLPTGSGKTAAIDIAVFHLALQADRGEARCAPVRIAFVVDRRLVVDDAFARAQKVANALMTPNGIVASRVATRLKTLSCGGSPLIARRLRGGIPLEDDWTRTPSQPTVLCSTVDQIGSRLLFRGYGVSDSMKPVHAGLVGSDCLILLDEAHLAEPFRQTLEWVRLYKGKNWRGVETTAPWGTALLTATPGETLQDGFSLSDEDRSHPVLRKRLEASKPARLIAPITPKAKDEAATELGNDEANSDTDLAHRANVILEELESSLEHFKLAGNDVTAPAIGIVVNRVARARAVFDLLTTRGDKSEADNLLLIGPTRPVDRDDIAERLAPIRTGAARNLQKPLIIVGTQCIEAGVDIDLDGLITEVAPLDALRQRFGRLNRAGRDFKPYAAILATKSDVSGRLDDPVYGKAIKPAWDQLMEVCEKYGRDQVVGFGLNAFNIHLEPSALSPKTDAPVLLPAHLDLLSQTSPIPSTDPDVALYLHGTARQPDSITVVWRGDIDPEKQTSEDVRRLLLFVSPRSLEAIELPLWAVRQWLKENDQAFDHLADAATAPPDEQEHPRGNAKKRLVFRWKGFNKESGWVTASEVKAGDTIVVPTSYGGVDKFGWNPGYQEPATDIWEQAARPFIGHRFAFRVAPGLLPASVNEDMLADALAGAASHRWQDLRAALHNLDLSEVIRGNLAALDKAQRGKVTAHVDLYGSDSEGRPRGVVFVAPLGIIGGGRDEDGRPNATEDDVSGSIPGFRLTLAAHSKDVGMKVEGFARAAGLPRDRVTDLKLAGFLHDLGKADRRFQAWLLYSDPLGPDGEDASVILAKSERPLPRAARGISSLPSNWRHEALSVRLAPYTAHFKEAIDPGLVLWLVGSHHGHGRPLFPHSDLADREARKLPPVLGLPSELPPGSGPQSLAYDWHGLDWAHSLCTAQSSIWRLGIGSNGSYFAAC
jgi:CRISPR-associated endonuclease/helicase Cas3